MYSLLSSLLHVFSSIDTETLTVDIHAMASVPLKCFGIMVMMDVGAMTQQTPF